MVEYDFCNQMKCRSYKFNFGIEETIIYAKILFKGPHETYHQEEFSYQIRGQLREMAEKVKYEFQIMNAARKLKRLLPTCLSKERQNLHSLSVYQKTRSEIKTETDTDSDVLMDIMKRSLAENPNEKYNYFSRRTFMFAFIANFK